jgi:hypothetical protein
VSGRKPHCKLCPPPTAQPEPRQYDFGHETNQPLNFKDIQSVLTVIAYVTLMASCILVAAAAKEYMPSLADGPSADSKTTPIEVSLRVVKSLVQFGVVLA